MLLVVVVTVGNKDQTRSNPVEELTISFKRGGNAAAVIGGGFGFALKKG